MAREDYMRKLIYLASALLISSTLMAKEGVLTKIVDGDTLYFTTDKQNYKCKVAYINIPKTTNDSQICKDIPNHIMANAGKSALIHTNKLLKVGNTYSYSIHKKDDKQVCEVSLGGGITFSEKMLLDGYAVIWNVNKKQKEELNFNSVLVYAKNENHGLWGDSSKKGDVIRCLEKISKQDSKLSKFSYKSK